MLICPFCGLPAAELTCSGDTHRKFLCSSGEHEWLEGDEPRGEEAPDPGPYWTPDVTESDN
jgi:hypothetical protein